MNNTELKEFLDAFAMRVSAELQAQQVIIDKVVIPKIDEIIKHAKDTNGRVGELEKKDLIRCEHEKNRYGRYAMLLFFAAIGASLILNYGLLEFLKCFYL